MKTKLFLSLVAFVAVVSFGYAQTATPNVNQTQKNEQKRINQGERSGELTKRESNRLERQQGKIQADKKMAKSDGVVTKQERTHLHREQRRASRNIYRQKHDAQEKH